MTGQGQDRRRPSGSRDLSRQWVTGKRLAATEDWEGAADWEDGGDSDGVKAPVPAAGTNGPEPRGAD